MKRVFGFLIMMMVTGAAFAADVSEKNVEAYQKAAQLFEKGEYDAAIDGFQKILATEPEPSRIYNILGLTYFKQGKYMTSAIGSFEQAIRLDPKYAEAYFNLATVYATYDPSKAAQYFKKTIEVDPQYSKAYFGLGWFTLTEEQDAAKAAEYFEKTLSMFPDFPEAYFGLGLAQVQVGQPHLALGAISQLRKLNRNDLAVTLENTMKGLEPPAPEPDAGPAIVPPASSVDAPTGPPIAAQVGPVSTQMLGAPGQTIVEMKGTFYPIDDPVPIGPPRPKEDELYK